MDASLPSKNEILSCLNSNELRDILDSFKLNGVLDRRRKDLLVARLSGSQKESLEKILEQLPRSRLKDLCTAFGLEESGKLKTEIAARLYSPPLSTQAFEQITDPKHFNVELFSTAGESKFEQQNGVRPLELNLLKRDAIASRQTTVMSAYYVHSLLSDLLGRCRGSVRVVLNGLGGERLNRQVKELECLQNTLANSAENCSIRLVFSNGIFHTKLYLFEGGPSSVAWIGSANATKAGLKGLNEEVLVRISPVPHSVISYAHSMWCRSKCLDNCKQQVNSLRDFFRTGTLYYEPYLILQKTLNPFNDWVKTLPNDEKQKLSPLESNYVNPESGIGAFNIDRVYEHYCGEKPVGNSSTNAFKFRNYTIETCYGYWVPECLSDFVKQKLDKDSYHKRVALERWFTWIQSSNSKIKLAYREYLSDVKKMLKTQKVDWRAHGLSAEVFTDTDKIQRRIEGLISAMSHGGLDRHSRKFLDSEVPEIWEDERASESLVSSFFDSLERDSAKKARPIAARVLLNALGMRDGVNQDFLNRLEECLQDESWYIEKSGLSRPSDSGGSKI